MARLSLHAAALLAAALACNPKDPVDTATNGTGTDASTASTTAELTTSTTAPGSTGTTPTTGQPQSCASELPQDEYGSPVAVTLRNDRPDPVFVLPSPGCPGVPVPPFSLLRDGAGVDFKPGDCDYGCDLVPFDQCGCQEFCPGAELLVLQPGASFASEWNGSEFNSVAVPTSCEVSLCEPQCTVRVPSPAGAYTVTATAADAITCADPNACTCTPNAEGWCWLTIESYEAPAPFEATADLTVPGAAAVELVFQ